MWFIIILIVIAAFVVWLLKEEGKAAKEEAKKNQRKSEEDRKRKEYKKKSDRVYAENFTSLYDHRSTSELKKIYNLLEIMHYNKLDFRVRSTIGPAAASAYHNAQDELLRVMGYPNWKHLLMNGKIEYIGEPVRPTLDMNYVYGVLNSRGIW